MDERLSDFKEFVRIRHNWDDGQQWLKENHMPVHFKTYWHNHMGKKQPTYWKELIDVYRINKQATVCKEILYNVDYCDDEICRFGDFKTKQLKDRIETQEELEAWINKTVTKWIKEENNV